MENFRKEVGDYIITVRPANIMSGICIRTARKDDVGAFGYYKEDCVYPGIICWGRYSFKNRVERALEKAIAYASKETAKHREMEAIVNNLIEGSYKPNPIRMTNMETGEPLQSPYS